MTFGAEDIDDGRSIRYAANVVGVPHETMQALLDVFVKLGFTTKGRLWLPWGNRTMGLPFFDFESFTQPAPYCC